MADLTHARQAARSLAAHLRLPEGWVTACPARPSGAMPELVVRGNVPCSLPRVWQGFPVRPGAPAPLM